MSPLIIAIVGAVLLVLFIAMFILSRIKVAGPNEAFIVTGRKGRAVRAADGTMVADLSGQKVVMGAAVFVLPVVQRLYKLDLSSREIPVQINAAVSAQGIRCDADAVAIVKVGGTAEMIRPAAQRFLHQQDRIEAFTAQVLSGALRAVVGRLTVEQIIRDRAAFAAHVAEEAERALTHQGLILDAFQLEDIRTAGSYLQDLGRPEAARVLKAAAIAEAPGRQATTAAAQANAERARLMGEGERARRAALAEANAIEGAKQGEAEQRRRTAIADAVEREGTAEASAILARGQAEAEAMTAKAEAFNTYGEAAVPGPPGPGTRGWAGGTLRGVRGGGPFRRLLGVRLISRFGDGLFQPALAGGLLFNPEKAPDGVRVATAFAVLLLPYSIVGPFVGVFLDRWSRRTVIYAANLIRAVMVIPMTLLTWYGHEGVAVYALGALLIIGINRFVLTGLAASQPHVVPEEQLVTANALATTLGTVHYTLRLGVAGLTLSTVLGKTHHGYAVLAASGALGYLGSALLAYVSFGRQDLGPDA